MAKAFKNSFSQTQSHNQSFYSYSKSTNKSSQIPQSLNLLFSLPHHKNSFCLCRKRLYNFSKINFFTDSFPSSQVLKVINRSQKGFIKSLEIDARKYFKYMKITKKLKSLRKICFTASANEPDKVILRAWRTLPSKIVTSLAVEYPYLANPSVLFRLLIYHKNIRSLTHERIFSLFVSANHSQKKFLSKRYISLWKKDFPNHLVSLRTYLSPFNTQDFEPLVLNLTCLSTLELAANNEIEDALLRKLSSKLCTLPSLSSLSLVFSECYSQQFLIDLLGDLSSIKKLNALTIFMPLCLNQSIRLPISFSGHFQGVEVLNLAISQSHRGHEHSEFDETISFYGFLSQISFPKLRKMKLYLETNHITKPAQSPSGLDIFLKFLIGLNPTLESLALRFWGSSLEYFHWEKIFDAISTLKNLESLELSETSYFNNFCLGLITKTIANLTKLKDLRASPVNLTKTRYLKMFVDTVVSHPKLSVLYLMINRFSLETVKTLLVKLKEFQLKTNSAGQLNEYTEAFEEKIKKSVYGPLLYKYAQW